MFTGIVFHFSTNTYFLSNEVLQHSTSVQKDVSDEVELQMNRPGTQTPRWSCDGISSLSLSPLTEHCNHVTSHDIT